MIEFHDAGYGYGGRELLTEMSLTLAPGSFHFLTGPSGTGKTTFLKLCYRELQATAGRVSIFGEDTRGMERDDVAQLRRRIGVVHQDCQFLDHLSVAENVALPLTVSGQPRDDGDLSDLLSWVGLSEQINARPPELSGGSVSVRLLPAR